MYMKYLQVSVLIYSIYICLFFTYLCYIFDIDHKSLAALHSKHARTAPKNPGGIASPNLVLIMAHTQCFNGEAANELCQTWVSHIKMDKYIYIRIRNCRLLPFFVEPYPCSLVCSHSTSPACLFLWQPLEGSRMVPSLGSCQRHQ